LRKHPFRVAIENGGSPEELRKLFAADVAFWPPMLTKPVTGVGPVMSVIGQVAKIAGPFRYSLEVSDCRQTILFWSGQISGFTLEAATILIDNDDGLISELRVVMRPWPVVTLFRDAMHEALKGVIPEDYWSLGSKPSDAQQPRHFTPIALKPIEKAENLTLHSPMLAKSVAGKKEVEEAVGLAHQVQSRSSYTSIIATRELLIELFDCDADGYPMEGIWVQKLNGRGQIYDLTVYLRPYPAVTVLRNRTKELADEQGALRDSQYWELKPT